jgi:hypothetical protein
VVLSFLQRSARVEERSRSIRSAVETFLGGREAGAGWAEVEVRRRPGGGKIERLQRAIDLGGELLHVLEHGSVECLLFGIGATANVAIAVVLRCHVQR